MNIGIITFHWAANHGAILQTYALQRYLQNTHRASVQIIDYCPKHLEHSVWNALRRCRPAAILQALTDRKKNKKLKSFRSQLPMTAHFCSNAQLIDADLNMDILITGSDQIWNPSFLRCGEKGGAPVYYLNFGGNETRKLSVSASFGCNMLPERCHSIVKPLLQQFDGISVRENTGLDILQALSVDGGVVTADPTALLSREAYLDLCSQKSPFPVGSVTKMILRRQTKEKKDLVSQIGKQFTRGRVYDLEFLSMPEWLAAIRDSKIVITNSFHCALLCLKLHTPFAVVLEGGARSGMNDRFSTLLGNFGLLDRVVMTADDIARLSREIDFAGVDLCMEEYAQTLKNYLERNIF